VAAADYVQSRRIGDATITSITEGVMPWAPELTVPEEEWRRVIETDTHGAVPIDTHVFLVEVGDARVLIDAGLDDPGSSWEARWLAEWPGSTRTPGVVKALASVGLHPDDITHVLMTHAHFDHFIGLTVERDGRLFPRYPNARVLLGRRDWEDNPERDDPGSDLAVRLGVIEENGLLDLVEGVREVVPGVTMIPAPGESPGHSVVRVSSNGEFFYAVGDLFHHASEIEHLDWIVPWADEAEMRTSRQQLIDDAIASDAVVAFTHETFPPWGKIVRKDGGYRWERIPNESD
jgi:glyoxylase-like metal-dependent hydrolase (beta-lactamase superfamily II)